MKQNFLEKALESKAANGVMIGGAVLSGLVLLGKLLCGPSDELAMDADYLSDDETAEVSVPADEANNQKEEE